MKPEYQEETSQKAQVIKVRAHHLLCMQGFQGYGYSKEFSDNLADVIRAIDTHPDILLKIVNYCDDICSCCPHNIDGVCQRDPDSGYRILEMDMKVLEKLGLSEGETTGAGGILTRTDETLSRVSDVRNICGSCNWKNKCCWFTSRENNSIDAEPHDNIPIDQ